MSLLLALLPAVAAVCDADLGAPVALSPDGVHLAWLEERTLCVQAWQAPVEPPLALRLGVELPSRGLPPVWTGDETLMVVGEGDALEWRNLRDPEASWEAVGRPTALHPNGTVVLTRRSSPGVEFLAWSFGAPPRSLTTRPQAHPGWVFDRETLLPVAALDAEGDWQILLRLEANGEETTLIRRWQARTLLDDPVHRVASPWSSEGRLVVTDEVDGRGLVAWMELSSGETSVIAEGFGPAIAQVLLDEDQQGVSALAVDGIRQTWLSPDPALQASLDQISAAGWDFRVLTRARDDRAWLLEVWSPTQAGRQMIFVPGEGALLPVGHALGPALTGLRAEVLPFEARDGLALNALLLRPSGEAAPPVVVLLHGGPWHTFYGWRQDPEVTQLAAQGYAVLAPNYRGSGDGDRARGMAARGERGDAMPTDALDALARATSLGLVDPERVAFVGSSFGGYAVLRILTSVPEAGRCGVSHAGRATLRTRRLQDLVRIWAWGPPWRRLRWSPNADLRRLRAPLLLLQGGEDDRVAAEYTRPFARRALRLGKTLTYLEWPNQGHDLVGAAADQALAVQDAFLAACLGGPEVELSDPLRDAELSVVLGAEHIRGLRQALEGASTPP